MNKYIIQLDEVLVWRSNKFMPLESLYTEIDSDIMTGEQFHQSLKKYLLERAFDGELKASYLGFSPFRVLFNQDTIKDLIQFNKSRVTYLIEDLAKNDKVLSDLKITVKDLSDQDGIVFEIESPKDLTKYLDKWVSVIEQTAQTNYVTTDLFHIINCNDSIFEYYRKKIGPSSANFSMDDKTAFNNLKSLFGIDAISLKYGTGYTNFAFGNCKWEHA